MRRRHAAVAAASLVVGTAGVVVAQGDNGGNGIPANVTVAASPAYVDDAKLVRDAVRAASRAERRRALRRAAIARARHLAALARARELAEQRARQQRAATVHFVIGGVPAVWQALAECESGGKWDDTEGMFEGGIQFLNSTWLANGGGRYARHAYQATPAEQVAIGRVVLDRDGPSQWPVCGPRVGLKRGD